MVVHSRYRWRCPIRWHYVRISPNSLGNNVKRIKTMMDYLEELAETPTLSEDMDDIDVILMEEL